MRFPSEKEIAKWNEEALAYAQLPRSTHSTCAVLCAGPSSARFDSVSAMTPNDEHLAETLICVNRVARSFAAFHVLPSADVLTEMLPSIAESTTIVTTSQIFAPENKRAHKLLSQRNYVVIATDAHCFTKFKRRKPITFEDYLKIDLLAQPYLPGASAGVMATAFGLAIGATTVRQYGMDGWTQFVRSGESPYADGSEWSFAVRGAELMDYQESLVTLGLRRCKQLADKIGAKIINMNPESSYQAILGDHVSERA